MKKINKPILAIFSLILISLFFSPYVISATTFGGTTFHADIGKTYQWGASTGPQVFWGSKLSFTTEDIYPDTYIVTDAMFVKATIKTYNSTTKVWTVDLNNGFYMAANMTVNLVRFGSYLQDAPIIFIIPLPMNLSLIGDYLSSRLDIFGYTVSGNTLISQNPLGEYQQTFNSDGILTKFVTTAMGEIFGTITLDTGDGLDIPYGNYFFIVALASIGLVVYVKWKKIKH